MGQHIHRLSDVNLDSMTAICRNCGPIGIRIKNNGNGKTIPQCKIGRLETRGPSLYKYAGGTVEVTAIQREEYKKIFGLACGICKKTDVNLNLDHCHDSGKIRGFLCHGCNVSLGFFNDDPQLLLAAVEYLTK